MLLSEFDYNLPKERIAQYPAKGRDKCRLMVLDRSGHTVEHRGFEDIVGYFRKGDCLVLNNTKVMPARLFAKRKTGGAVEIFLLELKEPVAEALIRPASRIGEGEKVTIVESGDEVEVMGRGEVGRYVRFKRPLDQILKEAGHMPLPPYIGRPDEPSDKDDYQTIYSSNVGATASPTAGLHFTREMLDGIASRGVDIAYVTLHTNYGTFAPVKTDNVEEHRMHKECFELPAKTAETVMRTRLGGGKVFAVGTTSARTLEHCASKLTTHPLSHTAYTGYTDLYIYPGYRFKIVDHLITNFHLPKSTLLLLVSAFAGKQFIEGAYRQAIEADYRFFSYGDAMLIM